MRTREVNMELSSLGQIKVEVTAHIDTVVRETWFITTSIGHFFIKVTLVRVVHIGEILHKLRTTCYINIKIIRGGSTLQQLVNPIDVWITLPLLTVGRMAIFLHNGTWSVLIPASRIVSQLLLNRLVTEIQCIISIHCIRQF